MVINQAIIYERIGAGYRRGRRQDPRIAAPLLAALGGAAMAVLTVHHWSDRARGLAEMRRVSRGPVVLFGRAARPPPPESFTNVTILSGRSRQFA